MSENALPAEPPAHPVNGGQRQVLAAECEVLVRLMGDDEQVMVYGELTALRR